MMDAVDGLAITIWTAVWNGTRMIVTVSFATGPHLFMIGGRMNEEVQNVVAAGKLSQADGEKVSLLEPGTYCQHKSWGVGRVAQWDLLADRLIIDFEGKPGHPMKLAFSAASLEVLPDDHIMARRLKDLPSVQKIAKEDAPGLVELALRSNGGSLTLDVLERMIKGTVVSDGDYKKWWESAKKALKNTRHIVVPSKRTEPLTLRDSGEKPSVSLLKDFLSARDLKAKTVALAAISKDLDLFEDPKTDLLPVFQDISDIVRKTYKLHLKESLHLLLLRDELVEEAKMDGPPMGSMKVSDLLADTRQQLAEAVKGVPVGMMGRLYRAFPAAFPDRAWVTECLNHLTRTGGRAVSEIASVLDQNDELDVLVEFLKKSVRNRNLSGDLLIWMCKERTGLAESVFDIDLGNALLSALEDDHMQGGPKRTGRLSDAFTEDRGLLGEMVTDADEDEVRLFAKRILSMNVFDELTRRSLMARVIKARPEMEALVQDSTGSKVDDSLIVSWESLERRKKELDELATVKIPQNKHDIQIARAEGDLRENGGYKAAREQQAVLLRMQGKMERELRKARGTDFTDATADKVGIGTVVVVQYDDTNDKETFTILGAWDGDVDKNIISYLSDSAIAMIGKKVGDAVELPTETTNTKRRGKIADISTFVKA